MSLPIWLHSTGALGAFTLHLGYPPESLLFWLLALSTIYCTVFLCGWRLGLGAVILVDALRYSDLYADELVYSLLCPLGVMLGGVLVLFGLLTLVPGLAHRGDPFDGPDEP